MHIWFIPRVTYAVVLHFLIFSHGLLAIKIKIGTLLPMGSKISIQIHTPQLCLIQQSSFFNWETIFDGN